MSIFTKSNNQMSAPNRNSFDGRFTNNLTLKMGQITPVFCKEVLPGDSFKIDTSFGFNFQPFVFPVQTSIRANLHFFYVRNRALWRGWESFITKTENEWNDNTPPYIMLTNENRDQFDTGKIGDFLGVPTIYYSDNYEQIQSNLSVEVPNGNPYIFATSKFGMNPLSYYYLDQAFHPQETIISNMNKFISEIYTSNDNYGKYPRPWPVTVNGPSSQYISLYMRSEIAPHTQLVNFYLGSLSSILSSNQLLGSNIRINQKYVDPEGTLNYSTEHVIVVVADKSTHRPYAYFTADYDGGNYTNQYFYNAERDPKSNSLLFNLPSELVGNSYLYVFTDTTIADTIESSTDFYGFDVDTLVDGRYGIETKYMSLSQVPFANVDNTEGERISAMPFRAVDACYNAFYRDIRNNPFIKDGKPLYNKWVYSNEGSQDSRHYELYRANWEQDAYTTAVSSPQQGDNPPLVGVSSTGRMTFQDENGNTYTAQATFGEDGETITGISTHSEDMPVGTLRALVDTISSGISINDFRNVNAYQVWLEKNMRKGLRYKDQIEAHFGTSPTYSELQMPEFIGGMSRVVDMRAVTQTSGDNTGAPLGTLAGQASLMAEGGQPISKYCDEHGFIIGFISFVPTPIYSQLLPKMLTKTERFDYYFPEFANIGFQPIYNKELSILQCKDVEGQRPNDVFGYQRAWHEYLANVDEAHGDFRTTMKNYIIHRTYNGVPQLSKEFLTVSPDEANEVFAVTDNDSDKIFGQLFFDVKMKRAIPKYGIPSLKVE